jgi:hypothetical protein
VVGMGRTPRPDPRPTRFVPGPVRRPGRVAGRLTPVSAQRQAPSYCHRYRPALQGHAVRSTTSQLGFRCVLRQLT